MYDNTLHRVRKHFCRYCLQAFRTAGKLKCHIKDCFKINGKQTIKMPKKGEYVKFKNFERNIKSPFLGEDAVYNFISSVIEESKYCTDVMKKHFTKELVMTKEDFENSTKCWICVISLENIEVLHIEIVISMLYQIIKFLLYFTTKKNMIHILLCKN